MLVRLPLLYRAEVNSFAGWTPRTLFRTVRLDVSEVALEDCEVSARNLDFGNESRFTLLWHEGSHWLRETPSRKGFGRTYVQTFDPDAVAHVAILGFGHAWRSHVARSGIALREADVIMQRWLERSMPEHSKFANQPSRDSTLEQEMGRLGDYTRNMRVIDGYLYRRVHEPYFKIALNGNASLSMDPDPGLEGGFRLDRIDDLRFHIGQHCWSEARVTCEEPIVLMPETFVMDDETLSFDRVVAHVKKFVRHADPTAAEHLRRAGARLSRAIIRLESGEIDRDVFVDDLEVFADAYRGSRVGNVEQYVASSRAGSAAARWRNRPMSMDDAPVGLRM